MEGVEPAAGVPTGATVAAPAPPSTPASTDPTPASTPADPAVSTEPVASDPNDPMAALEDAMKGAFPDEPTADPTQPAIPEQFQQALSVSEFVKDAETLPRAVAAADEVWKVATGQLPARVILEGFKTANPAQFQAIVNDLTDYLGISGAPQASPLAELQQANPEAYQKIAQFYQATTGKALDGSADPREARLSALEQQIAAENDRRSTEQWNQQVTSARSKATEFIASKTKGTFAEGHDAYLLAQCAQKVNIPEQEMVNLLLSGRTEKLEAAYKAVVKEEIDRLKAYNKNLVASYRKQRNSVPAPGTGGKPVKGDATAEALKALPGENAVQHATRLFNSKLV